MSPKDQAQHLSNALQYVTERLQVLEHELYTTNGNRMEIGRLKRVQRALNHDLEKLVKTIPTPVQFDSLGAVDTPSRTQEIGEQKPLEVKDEDITTPREKVLNVIRHFEVKG